MSFYQIQIDDEEIIKQISGILNTIVNKEIVNKYSDTGDVISYAVKDLIYSRKDEIIEKVVDRATKEIVRKGLPKLLEMGDTKCQKEHRQQ